MPIKFLFFLGGGGAILFFWARRFFSALHARGSPLLMAASHASTDPLDDRILHCTLGFDVELSHIPGVIEEVRADVMRAPA